jgi:hypothetical protein
MSKAPGEGNEPRPPSVHHPVGEEPARIPVRTVSLVTVAAIIGVIALVAVVTSMIWAAHCG